MNTNANPNPKIISIEGNIGGGKSTLVKNLKEYVTANANIYKDSILFLEEPLEIWQNTKNEKGKNILTLFYENPHKYAFQFQILVLASQKKMIKDAMEKHPNCKLIVMERSIQAGMNVFAKMSEANKTMDSMEYDIYRFMSQMCEIPKLDAIVYLHTNYEVCHSRINTRSREGEEGISMEYLKQCETYYHHWLLFETSNDTSVTKHHILKDETPVFTIYDNHIQIVLPIINNILNEC